jgi:diguanylate cyclase (GGDEF)-like protein
VEAERTEALLVALREVTASLRAEDVAQRIVDAVLRVAGARGAVLSLESREAPGAASQIAGETGGEPAAVFALRGRDEELGRLRVFGSSADARVLATLVEHGAIALANARAHEAALRRADYDALTGIANYGRVTAALERELEHALRYGRALALVLFDLDDLKGWNDRYGHAAGNAALVCVAKLLDQRSRKSDTAGRYGGDELVLVLPETGTDGALAVADKVRAAVASIRGADGGASLTISAGVASAPADGRTVAELLRAADERLYRAKAAGGNRVIA